jgi:hypothetical protein
LLQRPHQLATFAHIDAAADELEISMPGGADWDDIIAFREVKDRVALNHCWLNEANPWRTTERALQDQAVQRLLLAR